MKKRDLAQEAIILELMRSSGVLDSFSIFRRLKISFPFFFKALKSLEIEGLIKIDDSKVFLERKAWEDFKIPPRRGPSLVQENRLKERFSLQRMVAGQPYIPCIKRLDRKRFPFS